MRKLSERNIRKLTKVGGASLSVTLPRELVDQLGWKDKQRVVVTKKNGALVVRDYKNRQ